MSRTYLTFGDIGGKLRIPIKSPRHSEMMSPGIPTSCARGPVPRWRIICGIRLWDGQSLDGSHELGGSMKRARRKAGGAFFERGPLCRHPVFDVLLTSARRRL